MIFKITDQLNQAIPSGRLMGLDVGTKRIGVATYDDSKLITTPQLVLNRQSNLKDFVKIKEFFDENKITAIVIGLPLAMNGEKSKMSEFVEKFTKNFDEFLAGKIPIYLFDERLTSFEARIFNDSQLSRKKNKFYDDISASLILRSFLQGFL